MIPPNTELQVNKEVLNYMLNPTDIQHYPNRTGLFLIQEPVIIISINDYVLIPSCSYQLGDEYLIRNFNALFSLMIY